MKKKVISQKGLGKRNKDVRQPWVEDGWTQATYPSRPSPRTLVVLVGQKSRQCVRACVEFVRVEMRQKPLRLLLVSSQFVFS